MTNIIRLNADDLYLTLENTQPFYQEWFNLAQAYLPSFFQVRDKDVLFFNQFNFLSYSKKEVCSARINDLITKYSRTVLSEQGFGIEGFAQREVADAFLAKLINSIQLGDITLPDTITAQLDILYTEGMSVAQACRTLGISRYAANKLMDKYPADMYRRYCSVVNDRKPYRTVMSDCKPYLQDCPPFDPVVHIEKEDDPRAAEFIVPGALVAEKLSERYYAVSSLGCTKLVFTEGKGPIVHFPLKVLPLSHVHLAHKFGIHPQQA